MSSTQSGTLLSPFFLNKFIHDVNESDDPLYKYYGFLNRDGEYYILRINAAETEFRYAGKKNNQNVAYTVAWTNREIINYDYLTEAV